MKNLETSFPCSFRAELAQGSLFCLTLDQFKNLMEAIELHAWRFHPMLIEVKNNISNPIRKAKGQIYFISPIIIYPTTCN